MNVIWHEFGSGKQLAGALAEAVAEELTAAIAARGAATIAVSGGSTPQPFFNALSCKKIDWAKVTVTLVDERFVPTASGRSNARLVAHHLLQNDAARAAFIGLYHDCDSVEAAAIKADRELASLPFPLDVVILGMGMDQHTASFFPDAEDISTLLDVKGDGHHVVPVEAPSAVEPRLTLAMPLICQAGFIALHIEGADKKGVLKAALERVDGVSPIRAVLEKAATSVNIYWALKKESTP